MIPTKEEFLEYLSSNPDQTFTSIAHRFDISLQTVKDLVKTHAQFLNIKKIGPAYLVNVKTSYLKEPKESAKR
ncbi:MAG: hypothetical protein PWR32_500 [Candidatus Woesearchaeota archaeon]|nr:hypothetical protein [Candidatus Woesearchaeota archaeon]